MPFFLSIVTFVMSLLFLVYGMLKDDTFITASTTFLFIAIMLQSFSKKSVHIVRISSYNAQLLILLVQVITRRASSFEVAFQFVTFVIAGSNALHVTILSTVVTFFLVSQSTLLTRRY